MKKTLIIVLIIAVCLGFAADRLLNVEGVQDALLQRFATLAMSAQPSPIENGLHVFVCGSSSPLPDPARAQACLAVLTPDHFFIVDAGAGANANITGARLPLNRLDGVLLTHFHSDHIAELYEFNLGSWVMGRPAPMQIIGPAGVTQVVDGINSTYALDVSYRVAHHGTDLLPPELGVLSARQIAPGEVFNNKGLTITALTVDHSPVSPAVGYLFNYAGRSVLITGDTVMTDELAAAAQDVDLMLTDALSMPIVTTLAEAAEAAGRTRNAKIFWDITDYHADTESINTTSKASSVGMTAYYHLVPPPSNIIMQRIFERDLPDNTLITVDNMWFHLPADGDDIDVVWP